MKCPYCGYEHGWSGEQMAKVEGKEGEFFSLSNDVEMTRRDRGSYTRDYESRSLNGCPKCLKVFMSSY